jgi:hypothetical protein
MIVRLTEVRIHATCRYSQVARMVGFGMYGHSAIDATGIYRENWHVWQVFGRGIRASLTTSGEYERGTYVPHESQTGAYGESRTPHAPLACMVF